MLLRCREKRQTEQQGAPVGEGRGRDTGARVRLVTHRGQAARQTLKLLTSALCFVSHPRLRESYSASAAVGKGRRTRDHPNSGLNAPYEILIRTIVLITKAMANTIVHRLRLRSTSEPPPSGPAPVPTPNAPDSPESLPECIRTRNTSTTHRRTWRTPRIVYIRR